MSVLCVLTFSASVLCLYFWPSFLSETICILSHTWWATFILCQEIILNSLSFIFLELFPTANVMMMFKHKYCVKLGSELQWLDWLGPKNGNLLFHSTFIRIMPSPMCLAGPRGTTACYLEHPKEAEYGLCQLQHISLLPTTSDVHVAANTSHHEIWLQH